MRPQRSGKGFIDFCWASSMYLESVSILPQLHMFRKNRVGNWERLEFRLVKSSHSLHITCLRCSYPSWWISSSGWILGKNWMVTMASLALILLVLRSSSSRFFSLDWWAVMSSIMFVRKKYLFLYIVVLLWTLQWSCLLAWIWEVIRVCYSLLNQTSYRLSLISLQRDWIVDSLSLN